MSSTFLKIIPTEPSFVPTLQDQQSGLMWLQNSFNPEQIELTVNDTIQFVDQGDTPFFKKLESEIIDNEKINRQWELMDSCIHQSKLQSLSVDEAYRFMYSAAFCPYKINVTVSKKADSSNLHFILYQYKWDTADCNIINEFDKKLTTKDWEDITESLQIADFWGLKKDNDYHGFDGDDITVIGYKRRNTRSNQFHYVNRWLVARSTLSAPFNLILKLSGNKKGCFWVE